MPACKVKGGRLKSLCIQIFYTKMAMTQHIQNCDCRLHIDFDSDICFKLNQSYTVGMFKVCLHVGSSKRLAV